MSQETKPRMTFDDYLHYDDGTDKRYEFVDGELIEMPPESPLNSRIAIFLLLELGKIFPDERLCHKDTEIAISGNQVQTRLPDLMLLTEELAAILGTCNRGTITLEMPPPELIIEVVSPGIANENRDYRFKRSEYAARGVLEYWVINPIERTITLFTLNEGFYDEAIYTDNQLIESRIEGLRLTAAQILDRKRQ
ncbi:MAG: Uma2 family endonuclease [Oscillatoriales cyanobacterium C42_A2020_001]|nr:Uma2 family endonuclease [Leptolyngbyaceae cyanobacterium C42_A2020_001]